MQNSEVDQDLNLRFRGEISPEVHLEHLQLAANYEFA